MFSSQRSGAWSATAEPAAGCPGFPAAVASPRRGRGGARGSNGPTLGGGGSGGVTDETLVLAQLESQVVPRRLHLHLAGDLRPSTSRTTDRMYVCPGDQARA